MHRTFLLLAFFFGFSPALFAQKMAKLIDEQLRFANAQYKVLARNVPADRMPRNYQGGKVVTSDTKWWCSGFFPGSLLYLYEYTRDSATLAEAQRRLDIQEKEKHYTGNHDLGFMMFCSFGNAYRLFQRPADKRTIDTAAMSLATRFRPSIQVIQSWNRNDKYQCPVIIDNMMNLELLCWVSDNGGDPRFKQIAVTHADKTLQTHFRRDYASYHVLDYDLEKARLARIVTHQGYADSSAWARGQAWGLYGYTVMYRCTKEARYLAQAQRIAHFLLTHPRLPADGVPYWDFDTPDIPNTYRDASAGAIMASALLELGQFSTPTLRKTYRKAAEKTLRTLASPAYRSRLGENGGFVLLHSVGSLPHQSEVDVPLTYADYYFIEALHRYRNWYLRK